MDNTMFCPFIITIVSTMEYTYVCMYTQRAKHMYVYLLIAILRLHGAVQSRQQKQSNEGDGTASSLSPC